MAKTIKVGIIGLGWPGRMHAQGYMANQHCELVAIADLSAERRAEFKRLVKGTENVLGFEHYQDMLAKTDVDAVSVCLPNFLHYPVSRDVLLAGRSVICEKPPTMNAGQMADLIAIAKKRKLVYAFSRQPRFDGQLMVLRELHERGVLGEVYFAKAGWLRQRGIPIGAGGWFVDKKRSGGGAMIDIGIHALDTAWFIMGCPQPVSVSGLTFTKFRQLVPTKIHYDVDDSGFALVKFADGAGLYLETSWALNAPADPRVGYDSVGEKSWIYAELFGTKAGARYAPPTLVQPRKDGSIIETPVLWKNTDAFQLQQGDFLSAIRTGRKPINSAEQALILMKMLDAVYRSSATGREIMIR
jgi:predicted dehydrogenase